MLNPEQQQLVRETLAPFGPKLIAVFGLRARGDHQAESDLDLLVDLSAPLDLLQLVGIEQELSEELGLAVDLVMDRAFSDRLRPFIMRDLVRIDAQA
jgi:predicted nucleotidyltransferase